MSHASVGYESGRTLRVLMITSEWPSPGVSITPHFIKRQAEFLQAAGIDVDVFDFRGARRIRNYATAWRGVQRKLSESSYDLIHAQFGQSGVLALPRRLPLVVTMRGSDVLGIVGPDGRYLRKGRLLQAASRLVARRADAVIAVSEHMKPFIGEGVPVQVIPSGIDFNLFRPVDQAEARSRLGLPQGEKIVVFVGKPTQPRKRYWLAQQAMDVLAKTTPARLHVAWAKPHDEIPLHLAAADALLFTSMQEGSPNAVKEALACNLPVVSVKVGDVEERLAAIEGCEVCEDERPETIAAALDRALSRGSRVNGREAVAHLDERYITAQVISVYNRVLRRQGAREPGELATTETVPS